MQVLFWLRGFDFLFECRSCDESLHARFDELVCLIFSDVVSHRFKSSFEFLERILHRVLEKLTLLALLSTFLQELIDSLLVVIGEECAESLFSIQVTSEFHELQEVSREYGPFDNREIFTLTIGVVLRAYGGELEHEEVDVLCIALVLVVDLSDVIHHSLVLVLLGTEGKLWIEEIIYTVLNVYVIAPHVVIKCERI